MDILDIGLYVGYFLLIVAVLVAVGMPLAQITKSPGSIKNAIIGVGSIVLLAVVSYLLSSSGVTPSQASIGITPLTAKLIGTGLILLYIVLTIAVIALIYSEIHKATR